MARAAARSTGTASAGVKAVAAMVLVIVMALVVVLLVRARPAPEPFDPRSGQPDGARGLVRTLEAAGADVTDTGDVPLPGAAARVLVLDDRLDDEQRDRLLDFVEGGGVAVVADPDSTLHGGSGVDGGAIAVGGSGGPVRGDALDEANVLAGRCTVVALGDLRGVFVPDGVLFPVGPDEPACFTDAVGTPAPGSTSFTIVREFGDGLIVGLGDNEGFTNRHLRRADNAGLIAALVVPAVGAEVTFLVGNGASARVEDVGSGDETLRDLVPTWVWMSLVLAAVSFVVFAISRSARVGRIVSEPFAAPIAGSELVSATGNLMQRAGHASHAGWLLLDQLHRDLCHAHGIDVTAPLDELDRAVAQRSGTRGGEIEALLRRTAPGSAELADLSAAIDRCRRHVVGVAVTPSDESADDEITDERVTN